MAAPSEADIPPSSSEVAWPKISIVTPSFNQGPYLEKSIRSVLLQGYPNLEYIVIDGGSTDNSVEIIKKYEFWIDFWVSEKDRGQSHAINKGFKRATGDLLGWLNSDDYLTPGALFNVANKYINDQSVGAIFGQGHIVDLSGKIVHKTRVPEVNSENLFDWFAGGAEFMQPSCLFTRQAWLECGPLVEDLHYAMDLDLWIKIAKKYSFKKIDNLLSISLRHDSAKTHAFAERSYIDVAMVYVRHGREDKAREVLQRQADRLVEYERELAVAGRIPLLRRFLRAAMNVIGCTAL
jgi:glycosyltransferase involved in cell wall biosynthesis